MAEQQLRLMELMIPAQPYQPLSMRMGSSWSPERMLDYDQLLAVEMVEG
jgi:hypothetical protein